MVTHDPSSVPLADNVKFTENGVELVVGDALWATASANTDYRIYVTEIRRRHVLIDEERGMVFSFAALDHAGNIKQVTTTDGQTHDIGQLSPTTLFGGGLFKIINGGIHRIYTVFFSAPYGMKHGW